MPIHEKGGPWGLDPEIEQTNRPNNESSTVSTFCPDEWQAWRNNKGLSSDLMPGPVTWLILDGETHAGPSTVGLRTTPGEEDEYIPRDPSIDAVQWAREYIPDPHGRRVFLQAVEHWYPGRRKGEPAKVPAKVWAQLQKRLSFIDGIWHSATMTEHRADFWRLIWYDAVVADTRLLRANQAYWCGRRTLFGLFVDGEGAGVSATRWRCKSWTCTHCARYLQAEKGLILAKQLKGLSKARHKLTFCTLTLDPKEVRKSNPGLNDSHYEVLSWRLIRRGFKKWIRSMKNAYRFGGLPFEYTLRVEGHKSGWAHLHVVIASDSLGAHVEATERKRPHLQAAKQAARLMAIEAGLGRIIDVQRVKEPTKTGMYISKAATRSPVKQSSLHAMGREMTKGRQTRSKLIPRNFRTLERSRGWNRLCQERGGWSPEEPPETHRQYLSVGLSNAEPEQWIDAITSTAGDLQAEINIYMCPDLSDPGDHRTESPKQLENLRRRYLEPDDDPPPIPL